MTHGTVVGITTGMLSVGIGANVGVTFAIFGGTPMLMSIGANVGSIVGSFIGVAVGNEIGNRFFGSNPSILENLNEATDSTIQDGIYCVLKRLIKWVFS